MNTLSVVEGNGCKQIGPLHTGVRGEGGGGGASLTWRKMNFSGLSISRTGSEKIQSLQQPSKRLIFNDLLLDGILYLACYWLRYHSTGICR